MYHTYIEIWYTFKKERKQKNLFSKTSSKLVTDYIERMIFHANSIGNEQRKIFKKYIKNKWITKATLNNIHITLISEYFCNKSILKIACVTTKYINVTFFISFLILLL